ncbi:hypothetical protein A2U01_0044865, partial [Trifolium medium]|nr:hypothetical protein [Trifolium medium]
MRKEDWRARARAKEGEEELVREEQEESLRIHHHL